MNRLVSYAETSSDDEDKYSTHPPTCRSNSNHEITEPGKEKSDHNNQTFSATIINNTKHNRLENQHIVDLPITDESDDQSGDLVCRGNELHGTLASSECKSTNGEGSTQLCFHENKATDDFTFAVTHSPHFQAESSNKIADKKSCISNTRENMVKNEKDNICDTSAQSYLFSKGNSNFTDMMSSHISILPSVESESSHLNRKRKLSSSSNKQLHVPDSIHSMYRGRQERWLDNPAQHHNRIRSFPHLEGNWATHVFIPVAKSEPFITFVDCLLKLLMPATFEVLEDFHVSLSRTVTIRYHWMEPLVDSLRENLKCLKSCISDFVAVKLFTNDEKTRTFVAIELSQDDREFLDFVKAVDKSFAEFKLPAYYENPSFHISVGWCLGDAVEDISDEKLSKAQEMLGEFMAANPDLSFVYVQQICCQSGCKLFVLPLQDSVT